MTGSSELSGALNPNYFYERQTASHHNTQTQTSTASNTTTAYHNVPNEPQSAAVATPYVPHRSELENAVTPVIVPVQMRPTTASVPEQTQADPLRLLTTLMKSLTAYKEAVENERRRRIAWEKAQEAKCLERHNELQRRLEAAQEEISSLKATINILRESTAAAMASVSQQLHPTHNGETEQLSYSCGAGEAQSQPDLAQGSSRQSSDRKRPRSNSPSEDEGKSAKFRSHESGPQTIHAAMRSHILSCMALESDKFLPASHEEGLPLSKSEPVRFVWDQTTKKSIHNAKMKNLIVSDLLAQKDQYPLVPEKAFTRAKLDSVFEQAFTTFRQKYTAQLGGDESARAREEKSRRSRRLNRRKKKFNDRVVTREKHNQFSHSIFDAAFQIECMSEEESGEDENARGLHLDDEGFEKNKVLFIRYLSWRSTRLHRLFQMVDEREEEDRKTKPKRGVGRMVRHLGAAKDGNPLPPPGTPHWMVSKRWIREAISTSPGLGKVLEEVIKQDDDEGAWQTVTSVLGADSDDEQPQQLPVYRDVQVPRLRPEHYEEQYYLHQHLPQAWSGDMSGYMNYNQNGHHYSPVVN